GDLQKELDNDYDAVLIAGDIYDRSIPPQEAVELFSSFIERMVELGVQVIVIPGNHDSPARLDFASGVLERSGIHFRCRYDRITEPIVIEDDEGQRVQVFALPFVDEVQVRSLYPEEGIRTHQEATDLLIGRIKDAMDTNIPSILLAHAYTGQDPKRSESERELLVGNQGLVPIEAFEGFDHVALGHLHRPQAASRNIHYSGSLMPYSFSEAGHSKSSIILEPEGSGFTRRALEHDLNRRFSTISSTMDRLLADPAYERYRDHYLSIVLEDEGYLMDVHRRLRERFPYILEIDQPSLHIQPTTSIPLTREEANDPSKLFALFLEKFGWEEGDERDMALKIFSEARREVEKGSTEVAE
ncbi:MAG: exonuclease SbcCD subunit D, partial [Candidatus Thermoplasmatota archaeon]|nr:exonuclease SbcCD subunit D [Candidatus Thermoplasmatota archaeon]